jgi:hypothetical protein
MMNIQRNSADQSFTFSFDMEDKKIWANCELFIEDLKVMVPPGERTYDKDLHEWTIDESYIEQFQGLREKYFENKEQQHLWDEF